MKKFLALLLAAMMMLSLVACGGNETPSGNDDKTPSSGQQQEDNQNARTYEWPTADWVTEIMKYTGEGNVVYLNHTFDNEDTEIVENEQFTIRFANAKVDEVLAYTEALEGAGYWSTLDGEVNEKGNYSDTFANSDTNVRIYYYSESKSTGQTDINGSWFEHTYNLEIVLIKRKPQD